MRTLAREIDGMELPAIEKISERARRGSVSDSDRHDAVGAHAGRDDARGVDAPVSRGAHAEGDGGADGQADREADLPGELLPQQGAVRESDVRGAGRSASAARCRATLEELVTLPGVGRKTANLVMILAFQSAEEHLRRHARAPHLEPDGLGGDARAERDRAGALRGHRAALVAVPQPVSGDVGTERLPAGLPAVRRVRARRRVSAHWCRARLASRTCICERCIVLANAEGVTMRLVRLGVLIGVHGVACRRPRLGHRRTAKPLCRRGARRGR